MATQVAKQVAIRARRPAVSAGIPVVAAKITAPGMPDWALTRPRITKLIAEGNRWCPLTLVTAPAGSGKTMALALWAAVEPGTVAWVTVDEFDNRPGVFWAHVVAALRRSGVAVREALPATQGRESGHVFLLWLAAALAAQDRPVTLVLDDLHLLTDRTVLDGLDYVLRNTGAALRLLVAARMDPLLPLHRYRLAGELTEIGAGDLAFTIAEAGELMARHGCALTADSLECLTRRTEGWAAGLRLAAMSVRHTAEAGDWQLAATMVIDGLAISEIIQPWGSPCLASEFGGMPRDQAWTAPAPHLVCAAVALSAGRPESSTAALDIADGILAVLPADQEIASRLAAAIIRLTLSLRTGDLMTATSAAVCAEALVSRVDGGKLARHRQIRACVLSGRGTVELWSGHLDQAARTLDSGMAATALGGEDERADCLGSLALVEALRGRLSRAATLAAQATAARTAGEPHLNPAALVALAWVHLERYELRDAHSWLKQADAALDANPDKPIRAVARLTAAYGDLAEGRAAAAAQIIARARSGWSVPPWLDQMYISVNTVKTHLKHIYRKLATTRRGEAIRRARQLELI